MTDSGAKNTGGAQCGFLLLALLLIPVMVPRWTMNADYSKWAVLLLLIVLIAGFNWKNLISNRKIPVAVLLPLALTGWLGMVSAWQGGGYDVLYQWSRWIGWSALVLVVFVLLPRRQVFLTLAKGLCVLLLLMAGVCLISHGGWTGLEIFNHRGELLMTFTSKNALGCWLLMALPWIALLFFEPGWGRGWKIAAFLAVLVVGGLMVMSQSRSGLVLFPCLLVALVWAMWSPAMTKQRRRFGLWAMIGVSGLCVPAWWLLPERVKGRFDDLLQGFLPAREYLFSSAWQIINRDPVTFFFGHGLGIFPREIFLIPAHSAPQIVRNKGDLYSHNLILDLWMEGGLVGLILFLGFLGLVVHALVALLKRCDQPAERRCFWALAATMGVFLAFSLFSVAARTSICMTFFLLAAGGMIASHHSKGEAGRGLPVRWAALLVLPALIVALIYSSRIVTADALVYRTGGAEPQSPSTLAQTRKQLEKATRIWPGNINAWRFLLNNLGQENPVSIEAAGHAYRQAQSLIPGYLEVPIVYARLLAASGRESEAIEVLEPVIGGRPYSLDEQFQATAAALQSGDAREVERQLRRMLGNMVAYANGVVGTLHRIETEPGTDGIITVLSLDNGEVIRLKPGEVTRVFFTRTPQSQEDAWLQMQIAVERVMVEVLGCRQIRPMLLFRVSR